MLQKKNILLTSFLIVLFALALVTGLVFRQPRCWEALPAGAP